MLWWKNFTLAVDDDADRVPTGEELVDDGEAQEGNAAGDANQLLPFLVLWVSNYGFSGSGSFFFFKMIMSVDLVGASGGE